MGNLPIEGISSTRLGLYRALMAATIAVIVAGVALVLFTTLRDRVANAEVAATLNQSPSTTQSRVTIDGPQKPEEAFSVSARATTGSAAQRQQ